MSLSPAVAFVLAALGRPPGPELDVALGADRALALRVAVAAQIAATAATVAQTVLSSTLLPGGPVAGTTPFEEPAAGALTAALLAVLHGHAGPVYLLAPDIPRLDARLVGEAQADLEAGCAISMSAAFDGRAGLLALARPEPRLLDLVALGATRGAIMELIEAAAGAGGEVGFLRHERRLVTAADAAAIALDPLADPDLRALATP